MHERVKTVKLHCKKGVQKKKKTKKVFFEFDEEVYFILSTGSKEFCSPAFCKTYRVESSRATHMGKIMQEIKDQFSSTELT
jgi:hypothetical protein